MDRNLNLLPATERAVDSDQQDLAYSYLQRRRAVLSSQLNPRFPFCRSNKTHTVSAGEAVTKLQIRSNQHCYDAIVGSNLLDRSGELIARKIPGLRCAIVSDTNVARHFADRLRTSLEGAKFEPTLI